MPSNIIQFQPDPAARFLEANRALRLARKGKGRKAALEVARLEAALDSLFAASPAAKPPSLEDTRAGFAALADTGWLE